MKARVLSALVLLGVLQVACDPTKELREKQSAAGVLRAVEAVRKADNQDKEKALHWLAQAPCSGVGVCELRDACRAAYALHVEGLTLTQAAKQQLAAGEDEQAAKLVGSAEQKLRRAGTDVEACLLQAVDLRRRYSLE